MIKRYDLTAEGAQAVRDAFAPPEGVDTGLGIFGALLLLIAALSFARAVQRLIERAWELKPLSLRNTRNAALWIPGLAVYGIVTGWVGAASGNGLVHVAGAGRPASRSPSASWSGPGGCSARAGSRRATCCRSRSSSRPGSRSTASSRTSGSRASSTPTPRATA